MKTSGLLMSTIVAVAICSCSDKNDVSYEVSIKGDITKVDPVNVDKRPAYLFGDRLYAWDNHCYLYAGKLSSAEWQKSEKILVSGYANNKFESVALSCDDNGALYVLDRSFNEHKPISLTKIQHIESIASVNDQTTWEKYDFEKLSSFYQLGNTFVVLSDSTILVTGAPMNDMNHVFSIINFKNQKVTALDYWPDDSLPAYDICDKLQRYICDSGILWNKKDRFVYWSGWGALAFIFSIDGEKTRILKNIYANPFPAKEIPATERLDCCADSNRIYFLLRNSDKKGVKYKNYEHSYIFGNTVEVYDWNGVKQQIIHLDKYGQQIMLSKNGKTLYLFSGDMVDGSNKYIYSYDVSN